MGKLLYTGASGFLGVNTLSLLSNIHTVFTIGLLSQDSIQIDLSKEIPILTDTYNIVLHAAGKAHSIPKTKEEEQVFFDVNLKALRTFVLH